MGMALTQTRAGAPTLNTNEPLVRFRDEFEADQIKICLTPLYAVNAYRGASTLLGSSADGVMTEATWYYLEVRVKIHATLGEVEVRVNEKTVLNLTGINTKATTDFIRGIRWSSIATDRYIQMDDIYIDDAQFHGNCRVRTIMPDADSATHFAFDRSGGSNDYECVDEAVVNDDTDYIYSVTKGHKSAFGITTGPIGVVKGIHLHNCVKAVTSGLRRIKPLVRSGGADYRGPVHSMVSASYQYKSHIFEADPQDDQPWNQTKLEAAEFGLELLDATTTTSTTTTSTTTTS
jgi:hypothetical protein